MNRSIIRLYGFIVVMFALLVVWTSRWTVFDATALQNNPLNDRAFFADLKIKRGRIFADDGTLLATSVKAPGGTWVRRYPTGSLFAQPVGYLIANERVSVGLERSHAADLRGTPTGISSIFGNLSTGTQVGNDIYTTLDPTAQRQAVSLLAGREGSVVAIEPQTGAVKVLYSNPSYDDNDPYAAGGSLFDGALQGAFPPGSTFKVVTTAAALNSGQYTPNSVIVGNSPITVSGVPLENDGNQSWGPISLTTALTNSVNTVYAQVGEHLGLDTMADYMKRFGFYSVPPLDFPKEEMSKSGEAVLTPNGTQFLKPTSGEIDVGRMSIGQDKLLVTPFQMAMVAATVANGGTLMRPYVVSKVVNPDGQVVWTHQPTVQSVVMRKPIAAELTQMMTDVVEEGTGQAANLSGIGVKVAGKTGTAQIETGTDLDDAWFIGFAPASDPQIAVAVVLPKIANGYGGVYAAPVAAQVMKTLLAEGQ